MKCDELKAIEFYPRNEVDNIIGCLRADKAQAEENAAFWKKKAEDAKVENEMLKSTKRALWLARAMRADDRGMRILRDSGMMFAVGKCHEWDFLNSLQKKWQRVADKCRKKAEEYK